MDYFLHTVLIGAETVENEIRTIQCADDEGLFTVSAKAFVDATGDANLSRLAGAKLIWGNDGGHPQAATLTFRLSGVAADVDLSPAAVERAVVSEGRRDQKSYQRKGFILRMENSGSSMSFFRASFRKDFRQKR